MKFLNKTLVAALSVSLLVSSFAGAMSDLEVQFRTGKVSVKEFRANATSEELKNAELQRLVKTRAGISKPTKVTKATDEQIQAEINKGLKPSTSTLYTWSKRALITSAVAGIGYTVDRFAFGGKGLNALKDNRVNDAVVKYASKGLNLAKDNRVSNFVVDYAVNPVAKYTSAFAGYIASFLKKAPVAKTAKTELKMVDKFKAFFAKK